MSYFNKAIAQLIKEKGITQKKLAELLQTDPATVNNWVKGRKTPNTDSIKNICKVLGVSFSYFEEDYERTNTQLAVFDDLVHIEAINRYLGTFGYSLAIIIDEPKEIDSSDIWAIVDVLNDNKIIREFTDNAELSNALIDINREINDKLFYKRNKNYLVHHDVTAPIPDINDRHIIIRRNKDNSSE